MLLWLSIGFESLVQLITIMYVMEIDTSIVIDQVINISTNAFGACNVICDCIIGISIDIIDACNVIFDCIFGISIDIIGVCNIIFDCIIGISISSAPNRSDQFRTDL